MAFEFSDDPKEAIFRASDDEGENGGIGIRLRHNNKLELIYFETSAGTDQPVCSVTFDPDDAEAFAENLAGAAAVARAQAKRGEPKVQ